MRVLAVVAHPDDEVLGCGGTLSLHAKRGDDVGVVTLTNGVSAREGSTEIEASCREKMLERSCENLGVILKARFDYPDNGLDSVPLINIIRSLESVLFEFRPELVYTHFSGDLNVDHRIVNQAVLTACRPTPSESVEEIRAFEVVSSTHWNGGGNLFNPNLFIDISEAKEVKRKSIEIYREEFRPFPHQRSIEAVEALELMRGTSVGVSYAEAFSIIRKVCKLSRI
ncbi:MAG: hypothetical protein CME71_12720 [Halobacteriovorax sp.]|nr:hypothetical protein [Halobacteriovorax sp.]